MCGVVSCAFYVCMCVYVKCIIIIITMLKFNNNINFNHIIVIFYVINYCNSNGVYVYGYYLWRGALAELL